MADPLHPPTPSRSDVKKPSCTFCRSRKVRCVHSDPADSTCDQCRVHAQDCTYVTHQRGRKLGSKNKRQRSGSILSKNNASVDGSGLGNSQTVGRGMAASDDVHNVWATQPVPVPDTPINTLGTSSTRSVHVLSGAGATESSAQPTHVHLHETQLPTLAEPSIPGRNAVPTPIPFVRPMIADIPADPAETDGSPLALIQQIAGDSAADTLRSRRTATVWDLDGADVISSGICGLNDARDMFSLFWSHMANYVAFLDPRIHTLEHVRQRSPFLLAVILYTMARYTPRPQLARSLERQIQTKIWPRILLNNYRSVYIVQACMLWATFLPNPEMGEEDWGWTLFGHAIRIGVEVGLNSPGFSYLEPELGATLSRRNNERTWFTCFIADRSWAVQTGREPVLVDDRRFLRLDDWLKDPATVMEDRSIVALIRLRKVMSQFPRMASVFGSAAASEALDEWRATWITPEHQNSFRLGYLGSIYYHYAQINLRLFCMRLQDRKQNEREATEHAACLLEYAASRMPMDVYRYAHNNLFTMLSCAAAVALRFKASIPDAATKDRLFLHLSAILGQLTASSGSMPHKDGVDQRHTIFMQRVVSQWPEQQSPDEFASMLLAMFSADDTATMSAMDLLISS